MSKRADAGVRRRSALLLALVLAVGSGCGASIPLEDVPSAPIAYISQKASEGILSFEDIREAARFENPEDQSTLAPRLKTALVLLSVPTGETRPVPDADLGSIPMDWSADGMRLLFGRRDDASRSVRLISWNRLTGRLTEEMRAQVQSGAAYGNGPISLAWSALGLDESGDVLPAIWVRTETEPRPAQLAGRGVRPDVSSDGRYAIYERRSARIGQESTIMLASLDGEEPRALARGSHPRFSRDGSWITFLRTRDGSKDVWLMRADGTARRRVTDTSYDDEFPSVSPDGRYVVYASVRGEGAQSQLYLTRVSDGVEIQLTHSGQNSRPIW